MRLWTAMLGAWLAAGTGTGSAMTPATAARAGGEPARLPPAVSAPAPAVWAEDEAPAAGSAASAKTTPG